MATEQGMTRSGKGARTAQMLAALAAILALPGCMTTREGASAAPRDWLTNESSSKTCESVSGTYDAVSPSNGENPNEWLETFKWPLEGSLPSLIVYGANEPWTGGGTGVRVELDSSGRAQMYLIGNGDSPTALLPKNASFACQEGVLHAHWRENADGGLWSEYESDVWLYSSTSGELIVKNEIQYKSVQLAVVVPLHDHEIVTLFFKFPTIRGSETESTS